MRQDNEGYNNNADHFDRLIEFGYFDWFIDLY